MSMKHSHDDRKPRVSRARSIFSSALAAPKNHKPHLPKVITICRSSIVVLRMCSGRRRDVGKCIQHGK